MRGVKHITSGLILVAVTLWFSLSVCTALAASGENHATDDHAVTAQVEHGVAGDAHDAAGGHGEGSLSAAKVKDLIFRILNFAVLIFILIKFGAKPIASGLSGRQKKIKDEIEDLEARRAEAERSYREFEAKLAGMEKEIDTIVDKAIAQAEIEKAKIIEKAEKAADDIKRQAEMAVQNEILVARRQLKDEVADRAAAMAEELIMKNLTPGDQVKIIEDYLNKVEAVQ